MKKFEYVSKKEYQPVKNKLIELINLVQKEVKNSFTFRFDFVGSASRNMITREIDGNIGYDFDVDIRVNEKNKKYSPVEIKNILINGFNKHNSLFEYDNSEDNKKVITIKVKDKEESKIIHSCDFAIVKDYIDANGKLCQKYIHHYKSTNTYQWQEQPEEDYLLQKKVEWIKKKRKWFKVRKLYLEKKNTNNGKKSISLFAETIDIVFHDNGGKLTDLK